MDLNLHLLCYNNLNLHLLKVDNKSEKKKNNLIYICYAITTRNLHLPKVNNKSEDEP